ncbi:MAG: acetylglutamate kinase [Chloroflexi bacterium]|nr:acetylglutamate kinase [Chloroflexota bacterium]
MSSSPGEVALSAPLVIKIGGSTLGSHDTTLEDLVALQRRGLPCVVVHGGGRALTDWLQRLGTESRFVRGLRVTDPESLKVAAAVFAGLVNKELVASLQTLGGRALGLSGVDGGLLQARVADPELGRVGEVTAVELAPLRSCLGAGFIPVIAPLALEAPPTPGQLPILNINADTVAGEVAAALRAERLIFLTDVSGVKGPAGTVLPRLTVGQVKEYLGNGVIGAGMIPKAEACLRAARVGCESLIVDGREPHMLLAAVEGRAQGTTVAP